jgi:hypothetical protein
MQPGKPFGRELGRSLGELSGYRRSGPLLVGYVNFYLGSNVEVFGEHVGLFQLVDQVHQVLQGTFKVVGRKVHFRRPNRFDYVLPAGLLNKPGVD